MVSFRNSSCYNPTLLVDSLGTIQIYVRVSNIHFCDGHEPPRISWRDSVAAHSLIHSFLASGEVRENHLRFFGELAALHAANSFFPSGIEGCPSGPEDPRAFWSPGSPRAPWLLVSAWSGDCRRIAIHLIRFAVHESAKPAASHRLAARAPTQVELFVAHWPKRSSIPPPTTQPFQKNWSPFVYKGMLLVEYSIEPHMLLHVESASGRCVPLYAETTHPRLAAARERVGRVSGGPPPVLLASRGLYLGLAHQKTSEQTPQQTPPLFLLPLHLLVFTCSSAGCRHCIWSCS